MPSPPPIASSVGFKGTKSGVTVWADLFKRVNGDEWLFAELGETSTTAYRGDRGKIAYDHSQEIGNPHEVDWSTLLDKPDTFAPDMSDAALVAALAGKADLIGGNTFLGSQLFGDLGNAYELKFWNETDELYYTLNEGTNGLEFDGQLTIADLSVGNNIATKSIAITPLANGQSVLRINRADGTRSISMGTYPGVPSIPAIWLGSATPSGSDYILARENTTTLLNAPTGPISFRINNLIKGTIDASGFFEVTGGTITPIILIGGTGGPRIKNSGGEVQIRNNADTGYGDFRCQTFNTVNQATAATFSGGTFTDGYITWTAAQINRSGGNVELQYAGSGGVRMFGNTATPITFDTAGGVSLVNLAASGAMSVGTSFIVGTSGPRLKNSGGTVAFRNNADSADAPISASQITLGLNNWGSGSNANTLVYGNANSGNCFAFGQQHLRTRSDGSYGWANSTNADTGTVDTTISRASAGVVQIGTTSSNALGSLNLAGMTVRNTTPTTGTTRVVIRAGAGDVTGDFLFQVQNVSGTVMASIRPDGLLGAEIHSTQDIASGALTSAASYLKGLNLSNATSVSFSSTSDWWGTKDVTISRASAGTIQIGTSALNAAGSLNLANITASGGVTVSGDVTVGSGSSGPELNLNNSWVRLKAPSQGVMTVWDSTRADFNRLQLGGTTSSYPAIKRSGTTVAIRLADDSADAPISASKIFFTDDVVQGSTNTGIYIKSYAGQVGIMCNGVAAMYVDSGTSATIAAIEYQALTGPFRARYRDTRTNADANIVVGNITASGTVTISGTGGTGPLSNSLVTEIITDTINTGEVATRLYPTRNSTRLLLGKTGNQFYSVNFANVVGLESVPAYQTRDTMGWGYDAGASHNIGRSGDNVVYSSSGPSNGAHVWRIGTSYASFTEGMRLTSAGALGVGTSTPNVMGSATVSDMKLQVYNGSGSGKQYVGGSNGAEIGLYNAQGSSGNKLSRWHSLSGVTSYHIIDDGFTAVTRTPIQITHASGDVAFGANTTTVGNMVANGVHANIVTLGSASGFTAYPGIWFGSATPSISNYAFLADVGASQTLLNAPSGGAVEIRIGNNSQIAVVQNLVRPHVNDGVSLGDGSKSFSDLYLASGAVINFNNGNYTLTHSSGLLSANGNFAAVAATFTGAITTTKNGAVSAPTFSLTGTWYTGGTGTTTKPYMLMEPAGVTSTGWSTNGTAFGVNAASGFTGNMIDCQVNGIAAFQVNGAGAALAKSFNTASFAGGNDSWLSFVDGHNYLSNTTYIRESGTTRITLSGATGDITSVGNITWRPAASATPANNTDLVVERTSDTTLTFKLKGSDGTVRSGTITLSP